MAEDIIYLLTHLGWTDGRNLHVPGISMGGMIAQELAYRIPERILSLSLVVTRAGGSAWRNFPSLTVTMSFARLLTTENPDHQLPIILKLLLPDEWLDAPAEDDPESRTNREARIANFRHSIAITKPQTLMGALGQMAALITHRMSPERLAKVSASIPKVLILSAAEDVLIPHTEGENLKRLMPEAEYQCWEKTGHGICVQHVKRFNQLLKKVFDEGTEAAGQIGTSQA